MAEDPQPMTLQQRIAALNASHMARTPGDAPPPSFKPKPQPQVPNRRPAVVKQHTINIPYEQVNGSVAQIRVGNQPDGPPPVPGDRKKPPPLPSRKSSDSQSHRSSVTSITSTSTDDTNGFKLTATRTRSQDSGRVKAPAWGESELPPLPSKSTESAPKPQQVPVRPKNTTRTPSGPRPVPVVAAQQTLPTPSKPSLPPRLPLRKSVVETTQPSTSLPTRRMPPVVSADAIEQAKKLAFNSNSTNGHNNMHQSQGLNSIVSQPTTQISSQPPPVPVASRPDLSAIQATKPRVCQPNSNGYSQQPVLSQSSGCMTCRDFSGPDNHAAQFPRRRVFSLQALGTQLTAPFSSLTDKARAIFTWLHYNIAYDVDNFFGGTVKGSTPQSTLQTGLAVCEGYAALFSNIASYAGLESLVVGGHGKGFGYQNLAPGSPLPPFEGNHAWNAVKIDNGEWKLIDTCWGAGHVQGRGMPYKPHFNPLMFTMSNEEFGIKHFPSNKDQFFLPGGRRMSWEEYIQINADRWPYECEPPTVFTNAKTDYSIGERTVMPRDRKIRVNTTEHIRFHFGLFCEHWTLDRHTKKGLPPVFMLAIHGIDGRNKDHIPLELFKGSTPGGGGDMWYVDIPANELGAPGQTITLFAVTSFGDRQNARGLTVRQFREGKGRVGMGFTGIAAWDLV